MIYSQDVISEVRLLNDIVQVVSAYVKLAPRSGNHFGLCPFHNEKTPSFSVNPEKQIFYCFGCGAGGNVYRFIQLYEKVNFVEAVQMLAQRVNYNLPKKSLSAKEVQAASEREVAKFLTKRAARFYYDYLNSPNKDAALAREYLEKRGINARVRTRFGLGLSPNVWDELIKHLDDVPMEQMIFSGLAKKSEKNPSRVYDTFRGRLMFPIIDGRNRVVGFGGRIMKEDAEEIKYINTPETALFRKKETLYGLNLARKEHNGELIITEGYMDVIAMHQHGFKNTVGVLGTALSQTHARILKNHSVSSVVLLMDSDNAGLRATERAIPILADEGLRVKVLSLEGAKDPDEFLSKFGAAQFEKQLKAAKSHVNFQVGNLLGKFDIKTTEGKIGFTDAAAQVLGRLGSSIEIDAYAKEVADMSGISQSAILHEVNKKRPEEYKHEMTVSVRSKARRQQSDNLYAAKKSLVHLVMSEPKAAVALENSMFLTKEEIADERFEKLLDIGFAAASEGKLVSPAEIMDRAEKEEEQQFIAEIFASGTTYVDDKAIEKALNDFAKKIKREYLQAKLEICIEMKDTAAASITHLEIQKLADAAIPLQEGFLS